MQPLLGITLKIASALAFTLMSAGVKLVAERYPIGEVVFFRSAFAVVPLLAWLSWQGNLINAVRTDDLKGHLLRGIISTSGMFAGFVASPTCRYPTPSPSATPRPSSRSCSQRFS